MQQFVIFHLSRRKQPFQWGVYQGERRTKFMADIDQEAHLVFIRLPFMFLNRPNHFTFLFQYHQPGCQYRAEQDQQDQQDQESGRFPPRRRNRNRQKLNRSTPVAIPFIAGHPNMVFTDRKGMERNRVAGPFDHFIQATFYIITKQFLPHQIFFLHNNSGIQGCIIPGDRQLVVISYHIGTDRNTIEFHIQ